MEGEAAGTVLVSLDVGGDPGKGAESWIKITPRGQVTTRTGEVYDFEPEALAKRFVADRVDLPIDLDHAIARLASQGHATPAVGWIEAMEARPDGLHGRVEWLEPGTVALNAKTHRYVSPTFHHKNGKAQWLHSVFLVTAPALSNMPALADANAVRLPPGGLPPAILSALGLPATTSEREIVDAIAQLKSRQPAGTADGDVAQLVAELARAKNENRAERIREKVEGAMESMQLLPNLRDWALRTCAADEAGFDAFLSSIGSPWAYLKQNSGLPALPQSRLDPGNAAASAIAAQLGIDPKKLTGDE